MVKKTAPQSPIIRRTGPVRLRHEIPGRARFSIPLLVGRPKLCREIQTQMEKLKDVEKIVANPVSGSFMVKFHGTRLNSGLLSEILARLLKLEEDIHRLNSSMMGRELQGLTQGFNLALFEKTGGILDLRTLFLLALLWTGTVKTVREGMQAIPGGVTLLWWAWQELKQA